MVVTSGDLFPSTLVNTLLLLHPQTETWSYFANDGGVWRSADKGETVEKASNGLVITQFYNIDFWKSLSNVTGNGAQDDGVNLTTSSLSWSPT